MTARRTPEPSLPQKIIAIHDALRAAKIPHAFGGALALAYYAEPRATIDIDVNVFLAAESFGRITAALEPVGVDITVDRSQLERDGQCRLRWGRTPLDLFLSYDQIHDEMRHSLRRVPFAETTIPILSPEHLAVCKAVFDRPKDWLDIEQIMLGADEFDRAIADQALVRQVGESDKRTVRFRELAEQYLG